MCDGVYQLDHHLFVCLVAPAREIECTYGSPARLSRPRSRCHRHTPRSDGYICRCRSGSLAASRWEALQTNKAREQVCQKKLKGDAGRGGLFITVPIMFNTILQA